MTFASKSCGPSYGPKRPSNCKDWWKLFPQSGTENVLNPEKPENPKNLYKCKKAPLQEGPKYTNSVYRRSYFGKQK